MLQLITISRSVTHQMALQ